MSVEVGAGGGRRNYFQGIPGIEVLRELPLWLGPPQAGRVSTDKRFEKVQQTGKNPKGSYARAMTVVPHHAETTLGQLDCTHATRHIWEQRARGGRRYDAWCSCTHNVCEPCEDVCAVHRACMTTVNDEESYDVGELDVI